MTNDKNEIDVTQLTKHTLEELREKQTRKASRFTATQEEREYWAKIRKSENGQLSAASIIGAFTGAPKAVEIVPYPLGLKECREVLDHFLKQEIGVNHKKFLHEPVNDLRMDELLRYFTGNPVKHLNPYKGICLLGPVGRGKTALLKAFTKMCLSIEQELSKRHMPFTPRHFEFVETRAIAAEVANEKTTKVLKRWYTGDLCIDDLGAEEGLKIYGNKVDVVVDLIMERYRRYSNTGQLTHATTNIPSEKWGERYGARIESRLHEMFNIVRLEGVDKRKIG